MLHAPPWVFIDDIFDSLDDGTLERVIDIFSKDLKHTGVIHIGRAQARDPLFSRVLHLVNDPAARRLLRPRSVDAPTVEREKRLA